MLPAPSTMPISYVIDRKEFYVRGYIEIPVIDRSETLTFGVGISRGRAFSLHPR